MADSLSLSVIKVIKPSLETCYKEMISNTLIPSWERVCNSMFQQIHNTFTQGTKECKLNNFFLRIEAAKNIFQSQIRLQSNYIWIGKEGYKTKEKI